MSSKREIIEFFVSFMETKDLRKEKNKIKNENILKVFKTFLRDLLEIR